MPRHKRGGGYRQKKRPRQNYKPRGAPMAGYGIPRSGKGELKNIDTSVQVGATATDSTNAGVMRTAATGAFGTAYGPNVAATVRFTLLNGVSQGTDSTNRVGRQTIMKSLYGRLCSQPVRTTTAGIDILTSGCLRMIIFYDAMSNGTTPGASDIMGGTLVTSPLNLNNRERFRVLYDKTLCTEQGGVDIKMFKKFKRLNLPVQFINTSNTAADIGAGSLWLLCLWTGHDVPAHSWDSRVRFVDD